MQKTSTTVNDTMTATAAVDIWSGTGAGASVSLTPFIAEGSDTACIICPGGSYFWLDRRIEGEGVARWLQRHGISAFVLEYRTAGLLAFIMHHRVLGLGNHYPHMLQDIHRAIQVVRERSSVDYGLSISRLGVMGFSAGGHVALMSGIFFDTDVLSPLGIDCRVSLRPDFIASIYPVVTLTADCVHRRSRRGILGDAPNRHRKTADMLSLEHSARPDMPPVFLVNCMDDPVVDYRNSILMDKALTATGVPHKYIQYRTGGHGFGATPERTTPEAIAWKGEFLRWLGIPR